MLEWDKQQNYKNYLMSSSKHDSLFQVSKIDSVNSYYIVYLKKNNINYKIISKKETLYKCNKIQIGQFYFFKIKSLLNVNIKLNDHVISSSNNALVNCYTFEGNTKICKEEGIYDLYKAINLKGLCLIDK